MLKAENRLKRQKDFDFVYKKGQLLIGPVFNIKFVANQQPNSRFGFVVSKKTEKLANQRNLVKRRLRSAVLENLPNVQKGFDIVISIKGRALKSQYSELNQALAELLGKAKLLK